MVGFAYVGEALATDITITGLINFRDNRPVAPAGVLTGDLLIFGATNITPSGPGTTAQADQGLIIPIQPLTFIPQTLFPNQYVGFLPFSPSVTGSWFITATDAAGTVSAPPTNAIANPELIPLVLNLHASGPLLTPHLTWTLPPNLTGLGVTREVVRVRDLLHAFPGGTIPDTIFDSPSLAPTTTSYDIPTGVLTPGGSYAFEVMLDNIVTPPTAGLPAFLQNRSETFLFPYATTPEASALVLLVSGLAGLAGITWRRHRRK
jgi:hypothetical protein